jgi:non-heme chloroperoxidase
MEELDHSGTPNSRRRKVLLGAATMAAAAGAASHAAAAPKSAPSLAKSSRGSTITTRDGVEIYYKDWGPRDGQPIVFSHGWPLNADSWES